mgnify:CR=1 FL=1
MSHPLSPQKQTLIKEGKKRIFQKTLYPFQDYGTSIYDLLANPLKYTIANLIIVIILFIVLRYVRLLKFIIRVDHPYIYFMFILFYSYNLYINQLHLNDNITFLSTKLPSTPTIYDYEQFMKPKSSFISELFVTSLSFLISDFILFTITYPPWFKTINYNNYLQTIQR